MIKAILFDIDGVVIDRKGYFSERFAREYEIPLEEVSPFFKTKFRQTLTGEKDLKEILPSYLKKWKWQGNTNDFLDYWFASEIQTNPEVLKIVDQLQSFGIDCHLASNQEKYRAAFLLNDVDLGSTFDEAFFSSDLGVTKSDPEFFKKVLLVLNVAPEEVMFFDNDQKNINVANSLGIQAYFYNGIETLKANTTSLLSN